MRRLRRDIDRLTLLLERPLKQPKDVRDWSAWPKRFKRFEFAIHHFAAIAALYYPNEAPALTKPDPNIYRNSQGDFAMDNFPNLETAHDFKTFRKMSVIYESLSDSFMNGIEAKT
jgi:hypothetical protein